jgi:hypothetical protein
MHPRQNHSRTGGQARRKKYCRRSRRFSGAVANSGLALTFFHPAEFVTNIADHDYANNMNDKPSAVKKLEGLWQDH